MPDQAIEPRREPISTRELSNWGTTPVRYLLLSLYWFPISLFWGMMLAQILPARVEDFAGPLKKGSYLGLISVLGALAALVIQLAIGPISDHCRARWGRRRPFLLLGTLGAILAMYRFGTSHSFVGLVVSFFLIQLFLNVANGPYQAFIPDHVPPRHQGVASGFMGLMQLLGEGGGPALAGFALSRAVQHHKSTLPAMQHLLFLDAALLLACLLVSVLVVPDEPSSAPESAGAALRSLFDLGIRENPSFYWLLVSRAVFNLGFYIALFFLPYYVQDSLGIGRDYFRPLLLIQLIAIASALVGTFPAGLLADHVSKKRLMYLSGALMFVSSVAFAFAAHVGFAFAMAVGFGVGYGIFRAVDWAFACNLLPQGGPAKFMAIWSVSQTLPQVLAPAFGPAADAINRGVGLGAGWRAAMLVSAVAGLSGVALVSRVAERRPAGEATPIKAFLVPACILIRFLFRLCGGLVASGRQNVPKSGRVLICPNHNSDSDPAAVVVTLPRLDCACMAKEELFRIPVLGPLIRALGAFPIVRDSPDRSALRLAERVLRDERALLIFPEGRLSEDGSLQPLQPGAALLALRTGAPIIPVGLIGTSGVMPYGAVIPRRAEGSVQVRYGEPIRMEEFAGLSHREAIAALTRRLAVALAELTSQPPPAPDI